MHCHRNDSRALLLPFKPTPYDNTEFIIDFLKTLLAMKQRNKNKHTTKQTTTKQKQNKTKQSKTKEKKKEKK